MSQTPIPASRIRRFRAAVKPPAIGLSASSALLRTAAANSFKSLSPCETRDAGNMFELIVAIPHAPADERQVPEWVIFLMDIEVTAINQVTTRSRSYTIKRTPIVAALNGEFGRIRGPGMDIYSFRYDLHVILDEPIFDDARFEEYLPLGKFPKHELATFEHIFHSILKGPNNFFIARLLAGLWERSLVTDIAVEVVTFQACYSDDEYEVFGDYLDWDQYIHNVYYWYAPLTFTAYQGLPTRYLRMVNIGSLGSIATTLMEKFVGYCSASLLDLCAVVLTVIVVQLTRSKFVHPATRGSVLPRAARCLWYAARGGFSLDAARPEYQVEKHQRTVPWDKEFISELRDALSAFKICIGCPIFWDCMDQGAQVPISQAGQMETKRDSQRPCQVAVLAWTVHFKIISIRQPPQASISA
ncbi:hypothetical protein BDW68DRAFT_183093 [Aspergillus falconensis]